MSAKAPVKQSSLIDRDLALSFVDKVYYQSDKTAKVRIAENLRRMIEKFVACQGEFFLLVQREKDSFVRMGHGGGGLMPPHDFSYTKTTLYLGIISGEMRFGKGLTPLSFPIKMPYASGSFFQDSMLWEGPRFLPEHNYALEILKYFQRERFDITWRDMDQPGLDMAVGDDEVKDLIRQYQNPMHKSHGEFPLLAPVCRMGLLLKRLLDDFPEQGELLKKDKELFEEVWEVMGK